MLRTTLILALMASLGQASETLMIHEWGTFTALQDPEGRTIGGINTDEEALPTFVHDLLPFFLLPHGDLAPTFVKFSRRLAPEITMRLETPVVYVHVPPEVTSEPFNLSVSFKGGILSQFYPRADATVNGTPVELKAKSSLPTISANTTSSLSWQAIQTGTSQDGPRTASPVWLAPRKIKAARLTVGNEHERYLFYRGLGQLDAPLQVSRTNDLLQVRVRPATATQPQTFTTIPDLWLVDIRPDHSVAYQRISGGKTDHIKDISSHFPDESYSRETLARLKQDMHTALVADGLFADEAHAMLATWDASYFQAPGMRLFFLLPQAWTDYYLPMTLSRPAKINRVMMGRIELVTKTHQESLARLAKGPITSPEWWQNMQKKHLFNFNTTPATFKPGGLELNQKIMIEPYNHGVLRANNIEVPSDYQAYLNLGRFRDAIILHHHRLAPEEHFAKFITAYISTPWNNYLANQSAAAP